MRPVHLSLLALPLLLGSCSLTDSIDDVLAVANVKFSSADPAYTGPTLSGPDPVTAAAELLFTSKTKFDVLGEYSLVLTFHVKANNSGNSHKASFGQTVKPVLSFYINSLSNQPIQSTMAPFSVEANQVGSLDFPVSVPLTSINTTILKQILNGDSIPYYLRGSITFDLLDATGGIFTANAGTSQIDLATGAIPTRPSGGFNLSDITQFL